MLLIHQSHVFKLRVERKFEMCYPWSNRNATSVLQRRKPGKIEREKKNENKNKIIQSHGKPLLFSDQIFCQENVSFCPSPPPKKKEKEKNKTNKDKKKKNNTKQNIRAKNIIIKIGRRRYFKRTTFMSTPTCINTYCETKEGELNDFIA